MYKISRGDVLNNGSNVQSGEDVIDFRTYEQHLRYLGYIAYNRDRFADALYEMQAQQQTELLLYLGIMRHKSCGTLFTSDKDAILRYLMKYEHCPEHYFRLKDREALSLDAKKVLSKLEQKGYATEFLEHYKKHTSYKAIASKMQTIVSRCTSELYKTEQDETVSRIGFMVSKQQNCRYNYSDFDIISQIPKAHADCIVPPAEDEILVWGDFAQSDFRIAYNLFLRSDENDQIMLQYSDKYEALARIVALTLGTEFDIEQFKQDRPLYKQLTLATMYGTRSSRIPREQEFITGFYQFLQKCPRYVEFEKRLNLYVELGLSIPVTSYFGHTEMTMFQPYDKTGTVNHALNSPIQTGTSEIVALVVNAILERFYAAGYTPEDISLYLTRHDEPVFRLKKSVLKDAWIFEDFSTILVDNWAPLEMEFIYGYQYTVSDEELTKDAETSIAINRRRMHHVEPDAEATPYFPVPEILELQVSTCVLRDKTVCAFYSKDLNKVRYYCFDTVKPDEIRNLIVSKTKEITSEAVVAGYTLCICYTEDIDTEFYLEQGMYARIKMGSGEVRNLSNQLVKYMTCVYCKKTDTECPILPPNEEYAEWISSVAALSF